MLFKKNRRSSQNTALFYIYHTLLYGQILKWDPIVGKNFVQSHLGDRLTPLEAKVEVSPPRDCNDRSFLILCSFMFGQVDSGVKAQFLETLGDLRARRC